MNRLDSINLLHMWNTRITANSENYSKDRKELQ